MSTRTFADKGSGWNHRIGWLVLIAGWLTAPANADSLATNARIDLEVVGSAAKLEQGSIVIGNGSVTRKTWLPEHQQAQSYTANLAISYVNWRELAIQFSSDIDCEVKISLMGPWNNINGKIDRQVVLWDQASLDKGSLQDGDFEQVQEGKLLHWQHAEPMVDLSQWNGAKPVSGKSVASSWHNAPLEQRVQLKAHQPITLRVFACALPPPALLTVRRITLESSRGYQVLKQLGPGVNFGNFLEVAPTQNWSVKHDDEDYELAKREGFQHIRLPIAWHHYTGPAPDYQLKPEIFRRVDEHWKSARTRGLKLIINLHHFNEFNERVDTERPRFHAIWKQIAEHYQHADDSLIFELLNEANQKLTTERLNPILAETIKLIRVTNPSRTIMVGPGQFNGINELPRLMLPSDDENLIVTVHSYEPFFFTHQSTTWNSPELRKLRGLVFPGPPATPLASNSFTDPALQEFIKRYNLTPTDQNPSGPRIIETMLKEAAEWSQYYGRPIHVGEFGAYKTIDPDSRRNYYRTLRKFADSHGFAWCVWDWKAGFCYWDAAKSEPSPGMRQALFEKE